MVWRGRFFCFEPRNAQTSVDSNTIMGSAHTYVMPGDPEKKARMIGKDQVEVAFEPEELERLDADAVKAKYDQELEAQKERQGNAEGWFLVLIFQTRGNIAQHDCADDSKKKPRRSDREKKKNLF